MKTINDIAKDRLKNIYETNGAFYAFSKEQFDESKVEGVQYAQTSFGLIVPKDKAKATVEAISDVYTEARQKQVKEYGAKKIIEHEYFNYESQITGDTSDAMTSLQGYIDLYPDTFTSDLINKTFKECFEYAVEHDMF